MKIGETQNGFYSILFKVNYTTSIDEQMLAVVGIENV